ncbi:MAG: hypothetical protein RR791_00045 [Lachnospiraceae bacterium]
MVFGQMPAHSVPFFPYGKISIGGTGVNTMLKMNESKKKLISDTYGCGETYGRIDVISTTLKTKGRGNHAL